MPNRVLLVCHSFPPRIGGLEQHVAHLAAGLADRGFSPTVLTPRRSSDTSDEEHNGVHVRRLSIGEVAVPSYTVSRIFTDPLSFRLWCDTIKILDPDLIHLHAPYSPMFSTFPGVFMLPTSFMRATRKLSCPVVVTFHGLCSHYSSDLIGHDRKHVQAGDVFIAVDRTICRGLEKRFRVSEEKIVYIPNGVDTVMFQPRAKDKALMTELGLTEESRVVLVPRRIDKKNGIEFAIRGFLRASKLPADVRLILLGFNSPTSDPAYSESLRRLIERLGLAGRVICHEAVLPDRMPHFYSIADLVVIPSLWEATSLAALEAMASGVPVIASAVGGIPEVVDDSAGMLLPPRNSEALAGCLLRLLQDDELKSNLSRGAVERAMLFNLHQTLTKTIEVYRRVEAG